MIDDRVPPAMREQLLNLPVDWRNAYLGPASEPGRWRAYPAQAADAAGVQRMSPLGLGLARSPLEPLRRSGAHAAELISELRMGECLTVLDHAGDWWLVAGEDDYVGFARAWTLASLDEPELAQLVERRVGRFARPLGALYPHARSLDATPLSLGVPLLAPATRRPEVLPAGWVAVELVDGSSGMLPAEEVHRARPTGTAAECLQTAHALLGAAYRWGGRSPSGLDCSGLVQLCYELSGIRVPRDAAQQAAWGLSVEPHPTAWLPGDVLCFGQPADHVALWDGQALVHARARVRRQTVGQVPELMERLATVRRAAPSPPTARLSLWNGAGGARSF